MSKHISIAIASLFVASLFVASNAAASSYRSATIYVKANINQSSARTRAVLKKIGQRTLQNDSTLRNKAFKSAFKVRSSDKVTYLLDSDVRVTAVKLDMGKQRRSGRSLKGVELSVKVKSPAGNRTRTAKVKVDQRYTLEEMGAALEVEFSK